MKKTLLLLLLIPLFSVGQTPVLDEKNGFRNIKLGTNINNYEFIHKLDPQSPQRIFNFDFKVAEFCNSDCTYKVDHHYGFQYYVDENYVDENGKNYNKFPGFNERMRIYLGAFNDLISEIYIIVHNPRNHAGLISHLQDTFGNGSGNIYDLNPLFKNLQSPAPKSRKYYHAWHGEKVSLEAKSIHLDTNVTSVSGNRNLKYERKIGWRVTYKDKALFAKKQKEEERLRKIEKAAKTKKLLEDF